MHFKIFESSWYLLAAVVLVLVMNPLLGLTALPILQEDWEKQLELAESLRTRGDLDEALEVYEQVGPVFRTQGASEPWGRALQRMSQISVSLGYYSKSLGFSREAVEVFKGIQDSFAEAESMNASGLALLYLGDYDGALDNYLKALVLDQKNDDGEGQVLRLNNIANVFYFRGEYLNAMERYRSAMEVLATAGEAPWTPHERLRTVANLAVLFQKLGQLEKALDLYEQLRSTPGVLSRSEEAQVLSNLGVLYRHLGDPAKALSTYSDARNLFGEEQHIAGEIRVLRNVGILLAEDLDNLSEAELTFREVLRVAEGTGDRRLLLHGYLYLAEVERRLGTMDLAREYFEAARSTAEEMGAAEEEWKALYGLGKISESEGDSSRAVELFGRAIQLIESLRSDLGLSSLKPGFLADKRDVYDGMIRLLLRGSSESEMVSEVFGLMERARARTFQDLMRVALESRQAESDPEIVGSMKELRARMITSWRGIIRASGDAKEALQLDFDRLEAEYTALAEQIQGQSLGAGNPMHVEPLASIQALLDETTLVVEYWVGDGFLGVLWFRRSEAGVLQVPLHNSGFPTAIQNCLSELSSPSSETWSSACDPLSEIVLHILEPLLREEVETVVFVPDQALGSVPLEALRLPSGALLIEKHSVHYLPSASLMSMEVRSDIGLAPPWTRTLVAFGNPVMSGAADGGGSSREGWEPIPYSADEVREVARQLTGKARVFLGEDARKSSLLDSGNRSAPILHLSTHARIDVDHPERSRILFSPEADEDQNEYLFMAEVPLLDLAGSELVTLSACDTARGKLISGEGIQNFSRAFLLAGAGTTITSLWKAADQPTAEFMKLFYFHLAEGRTKAEALRGAKIQFINSGERIDHPFFWAAFIAHGDAGTAITLPIGWVRLSVLSLSLLLVLLSLAIFVAKRTSPSTSH